MTLFAAIQTIKQIHEGQHQMLPRMNKRATRDQTFYNGEWRGLENSRSRNVAPITKSEILWKKGGMTFELKK